MGLDWLEHRFPSRLLAKFLASRAYKTSGYKKCVEIFEGQNLHARGIVLRSTIVYVSLRWTYMYDVNMAGGGYRNFVKLWTHEDGEGGGGQSLEDFVWTS